MLVSQVCSLLLESAEKGNRKCLLVSPLNVILISLLPVFMLAKEHKGKKARDVVAALLYTHRITK